MVYIYGFVVNVVSCFINIVVIYNMVLIFFVVRIFVYKFIQNGINNIISCIGVYIFILILEIYVMLVINIRDMSSVVMMLMSGVDSVQLLIEVLCLLCLYN